MQLFLFGVAAGTLFGYVLQRADQCFHSTWRGLYEHRYGLAKAWILGVAVTAVGLTAVYGLDRWNLNEGLALRPVHNTVGGLLIGIGMVIAASCTSGLFYKLGSGMVGAFVGLVGWALGELVAGEVDLPGPTVLDHGEGATIPGWLGLPRWTVAVPFLVVVVLLLRRTGGREGERWRWGWPVAGVALGLGAVAAWVLAGIGGHSFGPSTVGAVRSIADGDPLWWLVGFLAALVIGAMIGAATTGALWIRGERPVRYGQLALGGLLLGAGGRIGGGCNLGHGLSGVAQLNVSSWLAVASILGGIGLARAVQLRYRAIARREAVPTWWTPLSRTRPETAA